MGQIERDARPVVFPFISYNDDYFNQSVFGSLKPGLTNTHLAPTDEALERLKIVVQNSMNRKSYADIKVDSDILRYQNSLHPYTQPLSPKQLTALAYDKNYEVGKTLENTNQIGTFSKIAPYFPFLLLAIIAYFVLRARS